MGRFVRGVGSLLILGGILVGVPLLLIGLAGNPFPTWQQLHTMVTFSQDFGNEIVITKFLPLACWVAWLWFAIPFLVEIGAGIRGRATRKRSPLSRGQQKLAATLVGAVALMFAGATAATAAPAQAATAETVAASTVDTSTSNTAPDVRTVQAAVAPSMQQQVSHVVVSGDTLWDIAETYYGDGEKYPEIFDANRGAVQPDGGVLSDPDLIYPGWQMAIPGVYTTAPAPPTAETPPAPAPAPAPEQSWDTPAAAPSVDATAPTGGGVAGAVGGAVGATTDTSGQQSDPADATSDVAGDLEVAWPLMTAGGMTGLLVAGVCVALAARRLKQRARRAVGERVAMPDGDAADFEMEMRMVENPIGVSDVDNALRTLQAWAEDTGELLPELLAVRVANDEVALYLAKPAQLPAPFESQAEDGTAWVVRPGMATAPARATVAPYPGLATIGVDAQGGSLLLDIEQMGSLNVVGGDDTVQGVLNALACEFATNPWSDLIRVTVVGLRSGIAKDLDRFRIQQVGDVPALIRNLRGELEDRRRALDSYGVDGVLEARTRATELEAWPPHIVILGEMPDDDLREELADLVTRMPRLGIATISNGTEVVPGGTVTVTSRDEAQYTSQDGRMALPFRPQILAGDELALVQSMFDTTYLDAHPADLEQEDPASEILEPSGDPVAPASEMKPEPGPELESESVPAVDEIPADDDEPANAVHTIDDTVADESAEVSAVASLSRIDSTPTAVLTQRPSSIVEETAGDSAVQVPDWPAPLIRVLGPVDALNIAEPDAMPGRGIEFLAFLLLQTGPVHGGVIHKAMWPDSVAMGNTSTLANKVRTALGADPDGNPLLPEGTKHDGFPQPLMRLDWRIFRDLIGPDLSRTPDLNLIHALRLVRGEPFHGTSRLRGRWTFAPTYEEEMRASIFDAADQLAHRAMRVNEHSRARFAARIAETTDPLNEATWRLEIEATMKAGDVDAFNRVVNEMYACVGAPDIDLDDATQKLIDQAHIVLPGLATR